MDVIFSE